MGYLKTRFKLRALQPGWSTTQAFEVRGALPGEVVHLKPHLGPTRVAFSGEVTEPGLVLVRIKNEGRAFVGHEPAYLEIRTEKEEN